MSVREPSVCSEVRLASSSGLFKYDISAAARWDRGDWSTFEVDLDMVDVGFSGGLMFNLKFCCEKVKRKGSF